MLLSAYAFPVYTLAHIAIFVWCVSLVRRYHAPGAGIVAMIAAGLIYDNLIVSLGASIGAGPILQMLSWPRFAMHALLRPFMMIAVLQFAAAAGVGWAKDRRWRIALWVLVVAMIIQGSVAHLIGLETVPACFDGILRYTANLHPSHFCSLDAQATGGGGAPIPAIVGNILTLIVGFSLWRLAGWPWLILGALAMFVAAAVPMSGFGMAPSNAGEVVLQMANAATAWRFRKALIP